MSEQHDKFLDSVTPNSLPLKTGWQLFKFFPSVSVRKVAPFLDGTRWTAKMAGITLTKRMGIFIVWREPKS